MANPVIRDDLSEPISYDPGAIERKWQRIWQERGTNNTDLQRAQRPFYTLMMFPYPSAEGLHVGNLFAFTGNDIYGRFQRLMGHNVFEPLGYDAFGIHSENYALKVGQHPMDLIPRNISNFRKQLERSGLMVDWRYTLSTTEPNYYKWTQWLFLQLFKQGLAYKKQAAVNWCPDCKTVLANEQVVAGLCERSKTPVEQRLLEQWFFRISDYAPRLLENLDRIDWSETTKTAQRNWIGRSEGADIAFEAENVTGGTCEIRVFTTRPDTIYGATYLVLAPEHPLVDALTKATERKKVDAYREKTKKQDIITRKTSTEKTGTFTGSYAINPATRKQIPIWVSDYVLMEYGTGAIMGVPGHDERDFEFATKFELPIVRVVCGEREDANTPLTSAFTECESGTLVNSGEFDGYSVDAGKKAIVESLSKSGAAKSVVHFRLHDWCISRQRYWGPPIPIIYCESCGMVPVPEKDLAGRASVHRGLQARRLGCFAARASRGVVSRRVPEVRQDRRAARPMCPTPSWIARGISCATRASGTTTCLSRRAMTKKWLPVNSYIGGNEHAVLHLLYSRFITMVLHDAGMLEFEEPFTKFRAHGHIIREGAKMSKTQGNIVNPDEYIEHWGADAFRTYLMFLGPYEQGGDFRDASISGTRRFLDRLFASVHGMSNAGAPDQSVMRKLHQTIRKVSEDIPRLSYNTAVAAMMEYMNALRKGERTPHRDEVVPLIPLVSPFAPHIAEELWEQTGGTGSVFDSAWPQFDPSLAAEDSIELVVQVNGRVRSRITVDRDITEEAAVVAALADPVVAKFVAGAPKKIIFVPGRLLNIVA